MAIEVIVLVLGLTPTAITATERLVLVVLANYADKQGKNCYPAVSSIARQTSLGRRTVQIALKTLAAKGFTTVVGMAARGATRYEIDVNRLVRERDNNPIHRARGAQSRERSSAADCALAAQSSRSDRAAVTQICAPAAPDPLVIRLKEVVRTTPTPKEAAKEEPDRTTAQIPEPLRRFGAAWGRYYRGTHKPTPGEIRKATALTADQLDRLDAALVAYFSSSADAFYRSHRHPFNVLVAQFDKILAAAHADEAPAGGRHVPGVEATNRYLARLRGGSSRPS